MVYQTLKDLPVLKEDASSFRATVETVEHILLQVGSFWQEIDQRAIMMIIQEKFPPNIIYRAEEIRLEGDKEWNLDRMLEVLYHIIEAKESASHEIAKKTRKTKEEHRLPETRSTSFWDRSTYKVTVNKPKVKKSLRRRPL